jgi:hypothetical protein
MPTDCNSVPRHIKNAAGAQHTAAHNHSLHRLLQLHVRRYCGWSAQISAKHDSCAGGLRPSYNLAGAGFKGEPIPSPHAAYPKAILFRTGLAELL